MVKKKVPLHGVNSTFRNVPKPPIQTSSAPSTSTSTVLDGNPNSEIAQNFELELCWCIQQLQMTLKEGKLNPRQTIEQRRVLNTLMSSSAPIIKKRQAMRMTLGDYRAKMDAEALKCQTHSNVNRIKMQSAAPSQKSLFIKKSAFTTSGKDFRLNFNTPKEGVSDASQITVSVDHTISDSNGRDGTANVSQQSAQVYSFVPSKNEFKFNFTIPES